MLGQRWQDSIQQRATVLASVCEDRGKVQEMVEAAGR